MHGYDLPLGVVIVLVAAAKEDTSQRLLTDSKVSCHESQQVPCKVADLDGVAVELHEFISIRIQDSNRSCCAVLYILRVSTNRLPCASALLLPFLYSSIPMDL